MKIGMDSLPAGYGELPSGYEGMSAEDRAAWDRLVRVEREWLRDKGKPGRVLMSRSEPIVVKDGTRLEWPRNPGLMGVRVPI